MHLNDPTVNKSETKCMLIHTSKRNPLPRAHNVAFDDCTICQVSTFKLLGVMIDHNLKWNDYIDHIMKSVVRNLQLL